MLDHHQKPLSGKWSYDVENRLKYTKGKTPPKLEFPAINSFYTEAVEYFEKHYSNNYGVHF